MDYCAGIDVSKDHLDLAVHEEAKVERFPNSTEGIRRIVKYLRRFSLVRLVLESTGGYERNLLVALQDEEIPVSLVNPWRVRRFGEGLGVLAKTDPIDARLLARFGRQAQPAQTAPRSGEGRRLAEFIARRRQLIAMIVAEKARLESASSWLRASLQDVVRLLERRVHKIDALIDQAIGQDPLLDRKRELIRTVPCVGPGITRALLIDLPELGSLNRKQIAALVGLAPYARDSGKKSGHRTIRAGRPGPRTALYLAAMNASRFHPEMRSFYGRLRDAGKPPKLAFVAVARKILTSLNAIVRDQKPWQEVHV